MDIFNDLTPIAVLAVTIILVIRELRAWFAARSTDPGDVGIEKAIKRQGELLEDLHSWHDVRNGDGVPKWYMRSDVSECLKQTLNLQREVLSLNKQLVDLTKAQSNDLRELVEFAHRADRVLERKDK